MFIYFNGSFLTDHEAKISIFDGGYMYGDGIYTTMRLYKGLPLDLAAHHARLRDHSQQMKLPFDLTCDQLRDAIFELVQCNDMDSRDGRLRITVSRRGNADDPLPLTKIELTGATIVMTLTPIATSLAAWQDQGIPVICLDGSFARGNFPKLKTLNSLATITALREAAAAGCPEALLSDDAGNLLEGAVSNIFLVVAGGLHTPANEGAFLAGRTRERILEIAEHESIPSQQRIIHRRDLENAQEVFVVSSVREVLPVTSIDGKSVSDGAPGPITKLIQQKYRQLIAQDLGST